MTHCSVKWADESLQLLPEHALWWPAQHTLFIADLHLGKAASFRALGQPVPAGSTHDNLQRLTQLVNHHAAKHIVCLGDFLHAVTGRTPMVLQALRDWRERHKSVDITLVRGNHDRHAGDPPDGLGMSVMDEPWLIGPFAACHHPQFHPTHFVLAGHTHPVVSLHGAARDRLTLPCFVKNERQVTLPAFGAFTGGSRLPKHSRQRIFAIGGGRVWPVPPLAQPQRAMDARVRQKE